MGRRKASKDIRNRRQKERHKQPESKRRPLKLLIEIVAVIGSIASVVGLLGFWAFKPRMSIDASVSVRPHDPFGTMFSLTNDGLLPIHNVVATCHIDHMRDSGSNDFQDVDSGEISDYNADILSPDQKMTLPCTQAFLGGDHIEIAKATIYVTYRPDFAWWQKTVKFPMEAIKTEDGTWAWRRIAR